MSIDHRSGDVNWRLGAGGDYSLAEGDWFSAQHAPEWVGDDLILYDNGNERRTRTGESRALRLRLDHRAKRAAIAWEFWVDGHTPLFGDVDQQPNGNVLVNAGGQNPMVLSEVTPDGDVVFELSMPHYQYRAERVPDLPPPPKSR